MTDLHKLAERAAAGSAEQQADLLADAWDALGPIARWSAPQVRRFGMMIDAGAYESAALMMVPEDSGFQIDNGLSHWIALGDKAALCGRATIDYPKPDYDGNGDSWISVRVLAATPALALTAAALRARAAQGKG